MAIEIYDITTDFSDQDIYVNVLFDDTIAAGLTTCTSVDSNEEANPNKVRFHFPAPLSGPDKTTLDGVVSAYDPVDGLNVVDGISWRTFVLDRDLTAPPGSPTDADRYIVATGGTGLWSGHDLEIVEWSGTAWFFTPPVKAMVVVVDDESRNVRWNGSAWVFLETTLDHGGIAGLGDDDHTQYHNDARGDARYYQQSEHITTSAGAGDSGKPIVLDSAGNVDASMVNDADIDHGGIGGLGDDDHTQYQLRSEENAASGYAGLDGSTKLTGAQQTYGSATNTACEGNDARLSDARAPNGTASGDLSASYPGPTVAKLQGETVSGTTPTEGQVLTYTSSVWTPSATAGGPPTGTASGDLSGTYPSPAVAAITTTTGPTKLTIGAVADGEFLKRSGTALVGDTPAGGGGTPVIVIEAVDMKAILSADWVVNANATYGQDTNNGSIHNRGFDDTVAEGTGLRIEIPTGTTNMLIRLKSRAETAPGSTKTVKLDFYEREIPDNAAITAWSSAIAMTDISIPTNEFWQYDEQTDTLTNWGLTAGSVHQIEIVRDSPDAGDDLVDDWDLTRIEIEYS